MMSFAALLRFSLVAFHCGGAAASPQPPACLGVGSCWGGGQEVPYCCHDHCLSIAAFSCRRALYEKIRSITPILPICFSLREGCRIPAPPRFFARQLEQRTNLI